MCLLIDKRDNKRLEIFFSTAWLQIAAVENTISEESSFPRIDSIKLLVFEVILFLSSVAFFFKISYFQKSFKNAIRVANVSSGLFSVQTLCKVSSRRHL